MMSEEQLTVGIAQIAPVWLNREATLAKVVQYAQEAGVARLPAAGLWRGAAAGLPLLG